jgi:hypothetical protein
VSRVRFPRLLDRLRAGTLRGHIRAGQSAMRV